MCETRNHFNSKLTDEYFLSDLWINTLKHTVTNLDLLEFSSLSGTNQQIHPAPLPPSPALRKRYCDHRRFFFSESIGGRWCAEIVRDSVRDT